MSDTTTVQVEPAVSGTNIAGGDNSSYQDQIKRQLGGAKGKEIKSFGELKLDNLPQEAEGSAPLDEAKKTLELSKKRSASEILRKNEGLEKGNVTTQAEKEETQAKDTLGEIESLSTTTETKKESGKTKEENLGILRKRSEESEAKARKLQEELDKERESQKARLQELEEKLEKTAFEKSDKFQQTYQTPKEQAESKLREFSKDVAEDEFLGEKALTLSGKDRIAFIDTAFGGGAGAAEALRLVNEVEQRRGAFNQAVENYKTESAALKQAEEKEILKSKEELDRGFDSVLERIAPKLSLYRENGDETHNSLVKQRVEAARAIIRGEAPEEDIMVAPFLAVIAKDTLKELAATKAELKKYKERISEMNESEVSVLNGDSGGSEDKTKPNKPMGAIDSIGRSLKNIR
jgi:hypothetical protein